MSVQNLEGVLDPKKFLEWGEQQLKKIEKERKHKSSRKEKQKKAVAEEQEAYADQNEEIVVKQKKKHKKEKRKHEIISINIEVNKSATPKKKKDGEKRKRKKSECEAEEGGKESCFLSSTKKEKSGKEDGACKEESEVEETCNKSVITNESLVDKGKKKRKSKKKDYDEEEEASPSKRRKTESDEGSSKKKKKRISDAVDSEEEKPSIKEKKRRIAEDVEDGSCTDSSLGRKKKKKKKKEHEGHKKKKGNDNNNEDVHSFCEEEESKGNSEKKKKKKKRETSSEGEHQQLETKKKKKTKSKEQVDDNTTENDIPVKKKKKKKKKDKTLNDDQDCGEADDEENSFTVQCAPVCNFKSRRCSSGFGRSPISRLLSKMEVCDVCPGNVCHQKSDDPRPSETVNETTAVVVIKQERMQDWAGYINKDAQPDASVGNKEPEESPLSEKANGDGKLAGDEVHETSNGEININIKQEKLDSHRKESESVQNENDSLNISIKQEKHNSQEILPEESTPLQNGNDSLHINIKQERNRSHEEENNVELENVVQNGEVLKQDNRDNYNTITTIENSSALNDTTFVNYYDDSFVYKDEFCNYSDPLADEEGNAIAQQGKDYLHSVITDNNYVRNLQCTISAQGEERRVTSVDGERHMLHFVNVYPKFRHKIQVSRILKVPLRLIYFHYYVTEGTKEFLDVYVKFNSQQNLKTAIQFYARRVRCENWCTKDENDLPEEVKEDVGNDHYPHEGHAAGYENPPRHRNEQWGRSYLHPNGRGRFNSQRGVHMGRRHLGASEIAQLAIANNA